MQCRPLTVNHSDTDNVIAVYAETVVITCLHGYQNSGAGSRNFSVTCLQNAAWSFTDTCERELNTIYKEPDLLMISLFPLNICTRCACFSLFTDSSIMIVVLSAIKCNPLRIKQSDANNVRGFYQDSVTVCCDNGYQTDSGKKAFEVQCGDEGMWMGVSECEGNIQ